MKTLRLLSVLFLVSLILASCKTGENEIPVSEVRLSETTHDDLANRYRVFSLTFDKHFESAMKKYNSSFNAYADGSSTRESYYNTLRSLSTRLTQMASFADSMPAPAYAQAVNAKRGSAATFLAQAVSSVLLYLETGDSAQTENADVFASQAYVLFTTKDK